MKKTASVDYPIHELIAERWSPYSFDARPVPSDDLRSLFEAARWSASSYNEQPWRFIVAQRENEAEFERMLSCLVEPNQAWAKNAGTLATSVVGTQFSRNGKPNGCAAHDVGMASANLVFEATARGLHVHQMAGILPERAQELYAVPDGFEVLTGIAIGYAAEQSLDDFAGYESNPRSRKPQAEFLFSGSWEKAF